MSECYPVEEHNKDEKTAADSKSACIELLSCPFCGEAPQVSTDGTYIEITCCASMERQKRDYLTREERETWTGAPSYRFSDKAEAKAWSKVAAQWNTRAR